MKILFLFLFLTPCSFAQIIEASRLSQLEDALQSAGEKDLVFFDVDKVLLHPTDALLQKPHKKRLEKVLGGSLKNLKGTDVRVAEILKKRSVGPIDPGMTPFLRSLHERKIQIFGLTRGLTGPYGSIEKMEELRVNQLQNIGIFFSKIDYNNNTFPLKGKGKGGRTPLFYKGILFTCKEDKGLVLEDFLNQRFQERMPPHIYLVDDQDKNLKSVQTMCDKHGILFTGIRYTAHKSLPIPLLNPEVADHQARHLTTKGIWLNDREAKESLAKIKNLL